MSTETTSSPESPWLRPQSAANYIGCSTSKLAKDRLRGDGIPFVKIGRLVLYSRVEIDTWLRGRTRQSTSEHSSSTGDRP